MPSSSHRTDAQVVALPSTRPQVVMPGLFHLAHLVDDQAQKLKELCDQVYEVLDALDRQIDPDLDPDLDIDETFDPEAARRLWRHVPDLLEVTSGVSSLALWAKVVRTLLDIEHRHGTIQ